MSSLGMGKRTVRDIEGERSNSRVTANKENFKLDVSGIKK